MRVYVSKVQRKAAVLSLCQFSMSLRDLGGMILPLSSVQSKAVAIADRPGEPQRYQHLEIIVAIELVGVEDFANDTIGPILPSVHAHKCSSYYLLQIK